MGRIRTNFVAAATIRMKQPASICSISEKTKLKKIAVFIHLNAFALEDMRDITSLSVGSSPSLRQN